MTKVLALETSTAHASVAVCVGGRVLSSDSSPSQRTHSEFINPSIERCLKNAGLRLSDIDIFAAGSGPGSFTGLRVSANIAKTFSMTFKKPLVTLDSLKILMTGARQRGAQETKILCLINAHKNMNYTALYDGESADIKPCAVTIGDLNQLNLKSPSPVLCIGEGYLAYEKFFSDALKSQIVRDPKYSDYPLASTLGLAAEDLLKNGRTIEWNLFEPLYIRASEAEENQRLKSR